MSQELAKQVRALRAECIRVIDATFNLRFDRAIAMRFALTRRLERFMREHGEKLASALERPDIRPLPRPVPGRGVLVKMETVEHVRQPPRDWGKAWGQCHDPACNIEREAKMVTIARNEDGKSTVWCDPCIAPIVKALNDAGICTVASCCGHKRRPGVIALADGRELFIARDFAEARQVDKAFPATINDPLTEYDHEAR